MTALQTFDEYIDRAAEGYWISRHFSSQVDAATTGTIYSGQRLAIQIGAVYDAGSMPPGVSAYRLTSGLLYSSTQTPFLVGKTVYLGAYNLGTGLFDTGGPMSTLIEGGVSRQIYSSVLVYAATALTLTSGTSLSLRVQYVDQDNNAAELSPSFTLGTSVTSNTAGFLKLNTNDYGVLDITGTSTTGTGVYTGIIAFIGIVPIGVFNPTLQNTATPMQLNLLTKNPCPPIVNANEQLILINFSNAAKRYQGTFTFVGEPT